MSTCDAEEVAKLDAVLAGVNRLIEGLSIEINDGSSIVSDIRVKKQTNMPSRGDANAFARTLNDISSPDDLLLNAEDSDGSPPRKHERSEISDNRTAFSGKDENSEQFLYKESQKSLIQAGDFYAGDELTKTKTNLQLNEISEEEEEILSQVGVYQKTNDGVYLDLKNKQVTTTLSNAENPQTAKKIVTSSDTATYSTKEQNRVEQTNSVPDSFLSGVLNHSSVQAKSSDKAPKGDLRYCKQESSSYNNRNNKKILKKANSENCGLFFRGNAKSGSLSTYAALVDSRQTSNSVETSPKLGKEKLSITPSFAEKLNSRKDNHLFAIKSFLSRRKVSKGKESIDLNQLTNDQSNFSCFHGSGEGKRKLSDSFELQGSPNLKKTTNSSKISNKGSTKRKPLFRQKRLGHYFRRGQSLEARRAEEDLEHKLQNLKAEFVSLTSQNSLNETIAVSGESENTQASATGADADKCMYCVAAKIESDNVTSLKENVSEISSDKIEDHSCQSQPIACKSVTADAVHEGTRHKGNFTFFHTYIKGRKSSLESGATKGFCSLEEIKNKVGEIPRRRATMDAACIHHHHHHHQWPLRISGSTTIYSSLPRKLRQSASLSHSRAGALHKISRNWISTDADEPPKHSEDSLNLVTSSRRRSYSRQRLGSKGRKHFDNDQPGLESISRLANKIGMKNKFRKSLKKGNSLTIPDSDEMAERTWSPYGDCTWTNMSGKMVELGSTRLQSLSELECDALQKVALNRLYEADLGVTIIIPKDESKILNGKVSMKKKYGVYLSSKEKNRDKHFDHVFGIPLVNVVENDQLLRLQKSASFAPPLEYQDSCNDSAAAVGATSSLSSNSSRSGSVSSLQNHHTTCTPNQDKVNATTSANSVFKSSSTENLLEGNELLSNPNMTECEKLTNKENASSTRLQSPNAAKSNSSTAAQPLRRRGAIAADSISEIDPYQSQILEALSLSVAGTTHSQRKEAKRSLLPPTMAQVPYVVQKCCDHIKKYGLNVTGIFRVAGSKKRVKQLREEFDGGMDVTIDEDYNPHDVAALLKEFFRDLPEALLTRELYPVFIQASKLEKSQRLACLRCLMWLLPQSNRDTLRTLLSFLSLVAAHSEPTTDSARSNVTGNKMSIFNLATIFGPNILHRNKKTGQNDFQVQSIEKAEESGAVIKVVEDLISNQIKLFQIPKEEHDEMLRVLKETDPEAVDFLLRRKAANHLRERSRASNFPFTVPQQAFEDNSSLNSVDIISEHQIHANDPAEEHEQVNEDPVDSTSEHDSSNECLFKQMSLHHGSGQIVVQEEEEEEERKANLIIERNDEASSAKIYSDFEELLTDKKDEKPKANLDETLEIPLEDNSDASVVERCDLPVSLIETKLESNLSMSFTADDLRAILGSKDENKACYKMNSSEVHESAFSPFLSAKETTRETLDPGATEEKVYQVTDDIQIRIPSQAILQAGSSDSGVSVDSVKNSTSISPPDVNEQRGEYSLLFQAPSEQLDVATDLDGTVDEEDEFRNLLAANFCNSVEKTNKDTLESCAEDEGVHESLDIYFKTADGLSAASVEDQCSNSFITSTNILINNPLNGHNENETNVGTFFAKIGCENEILRLDPESMLAVSVILNPKPKLSHVETAHLLPMSCEEQMNATKQPESLPRFSVPVSTSPRVQRQYNGLTARAISQTETPSTPLNLMKQNDGHNYANSSLHDYKPRDKNLTTKTRNIPLVQNTSEVLHESRRLQRKPQTRVMPAVRNNVAALVERYSKGDSSLKKDLKSIPGSRWTSQGLLGQTNTKQNVLSPKQADSMKTSDTPGTPTRDERPAWFAVLSDCKQLPETFV